MSRLPATRHPLRPRGGLRLVLVLAGLGSIVSGSVACGEDVLVARFELTSNVPDAGPFEEGADAGRVNGQSINAERARDRARRNERANEHAPPRPDEADKSH